MMLCTWALDVVIHKLSKEELILSQQIASQRIHAPSYYSEDQDMSYFSRRYSIEYVRFLGAVSHFF